MLTVTEAETLAVMLGSASRKMADTIAPAAAPGQDPYVWQGRTGYEAAADMFAAFYAIAPRGIYI